jgi:conjugal transfer/entry exclusion protein
MKEAKAECGLLPTYYYLGTGTDYNGLCTAVNTGIVASATTDLVETQNTSVLKQAEQYAKQIEEVQNLVIQTEMMIKDLEENPLQVIMPDIDHLIANQKRIDDLANSIATNSSQVGSNLMNNLTHPNTIGLGKGSRFALWSEARRKNAEESYAKSTQFLKDLQKENVSITQAIKNINATQDKTATLKATGNIAGQQLSQMAKMTELLNQLMGAQAVDNGEKVDREIYGAQVNDKLSKEGFGAKVEIPTTDTYIGPGSITSRAF